MTTNTVFNIGDIVKIINDKNKRYSWTRKGSWGKITRIVDDETVLIKFEQVYNSDGHLRNLNVYTLREFIIDIKDLALLQKAVVVTPQDKVISKIRELEKRFYANQNIIGLWRSVKDTKLR